MSMTTYLLHTNSLSPNQIQLISSTLGAKPTSIANHFRITTSQTADIKQLANDLKIDINELPTNFNPSEIKLLISDMDSTLIGIECIDEIADMMGIKPKISAITEAAMRGELDFEASLKQRVSLLKGLDTSALETVYKERLFLNPGAEQWVEGLKTQGIKFALVSGGFTYFTNRLQQQLKLDFSRANLLSEKNGKLTGEVSGKIIDAQAKADFLQELCTDLDIKPSQVIAIGDGANDLLMMKKAGLSIAFQAKPAVQKQANASLNVSPLSAVLDFLQ